MRTQAEIKHNNEQFDQIYKIAKNAATDEAGAIEK